MSSPPIPGLCAICAYRATEYGSTFHVKEPHGGPHEPGWRTVTGPEVHQILHAWSQAGSQFYLEGARVTNPLLVEGEEYLPMLPVTMVAGVGVCAAHAVCLLPRGGKR